MILKKEYGSKSAALTALAVAAPCLLLDAAAWEVTVWSLLVVPAGVGVAAWLSGVALQAHRRERLLRVPGVAIEPSSPEWDLFERAWSAARRLQRLARRVLPAPYADRLRHEVAATARDVYGLAGATSELSRQVRGIDATRLDREAAQLRACRTDAAPRAAVALDRSLEALSDTRAVLDRMTAAREVALARLGADVHVLEGLYARVLELRAAHAPAPPDRLDALAAELEALRRGIEEAAELSRDALSAHDA